MANRIDKIYFAVDTGLSYNGEGDEFSNQNQAYISSKENPAYEWIYVTDWVDKDNFTEYTGFAGSSISSSATIDNDYNHVIDGSLVGGLSGAITSIIVSGLAEKPVQTGFIQLVNGADESETIDYTAVTTNGSNLEFTVAVTLANSYVDGDEANMSDPALCKTFDVDIDSSGKDTGVFIIPMNANTIPYLRAVKNKPTISDCKFEHQVRDDQGVLIFRQSIDIVCNNIQDDDGVIPPPSNGLYYTKDETLALLADKMDKQPGATLGNAAAFDASGQVVDAGGPPGIGDMTKAVYDGANIAEQVVGETATQTLTNKNLVAVKIQDYEEFTAITAPVHKANTLYYDIDEHSFVATNDIPDVALNIGEELWGRVKNDSVTTFGNGQVGYVIGSLNGSLKCGLLDASDIDKSRRTIGLFTNEIAPLTGEGYITRFGEVRGLNTVGCTQGDIIYADPANIGGWTNVRPDAPFYPVRIGVCLFVDAVNGVIGVDTVAFNGTDTSVNIEGTLNGVVVETPKVNFYESLGVVYAEITNEKNPASNLDFIIDGNRYQIDTLTNTGPNGGAIAALTMGADTETLFENFLYLHLNGSTPEFKISTLSTTDEYCPIGIAAVFDFTRTQSEGVFKFRRSNDAPDNGSADGFNRWLADAVRSKLGTTYTSGCEATVIVNSTPSVTISTAIGVAKQVHNSTFSAQNGTSYTIYNDSTNAVTYEQVSDLASIVADASGGTLAVNGAYYRLKIYGVQNSDSYGALASADKLLVTRPLGYYADSASAIADSNNFDVNANDILVEGVLFPLYTLVISRTGGGGATWTLIETQDNKSRLISGGGGGGGAAGGGGADELAKVSASDNTSSYLNDKIVAGTGVTKTILNPAGNEQIEMSADPSNIDHDLLAGKDLANTGVPFGHIDDQAQDIAGIKTFTAFPVTPSSLPVSDYQVGNKIYIDSVATPFWSSVVPLTLDYQIVDANDLSKWFQLSPATVAQRTITTDPTSADKFNFWVSSENATYDVVVAGVDVATVDSHAVTNIDDGSFTSTTYGRAFCFNSTGDFNKITFALKKIGTPTGTIYYRVYNTSGTIDVDAIPTGSPISEGTLDIATTTTSYVSYEITLDSVVPSGDCAISVEWSGGNDLVLKQDLDPSSRTGNRVFQNESLVWVYIDNKDIEFNTAFSETINGQSSVTVSKDNANPVQFVKDGSDYKQLFYEESAGGGGAIQSIKVQEQTSSGVDAGASSAGENIRGLNTVVYNNITGASLSSNQLTLPAGKYLISAHAATNVSNGATVILRNISGEAFSDITGISFYNNSSANQYPFIDKFEIEFSASTTFDLRSDNSIARSPDGLGKASSLGFSEVFSEINAIKIG